MILCDRNSLCSHRRSQYNEKRGGRYKYGKYTIAHSYLEPAGFIWRANITTQFKYFLSFVIHVVEGFVLIKVMETCNIHVFQHWICLACHLIDHQTSKLHKLIFNNGVTSLNDIISIRNRCWNRYFTNYNAIPINTDIVFHHIFSSNSLIHNGHSCSLIKHYA